MYSAKSRMRVVKAASEDHRIKLPVSENAIDRRAIPTLSKTIAIKTDPANGLAAVWMKVHGGAEFEHPVSSRLCIVLAFHLLQAASRNMAPPGLLLAIRALRGAVHTKG